MRQTRTPILALAISALLMMSGCVGSLDETLNLAEEDLEDGNVAVTLTATNVPEGLSHVGFEFDQAFLHDAEVEAPDGYHELTLAEDRADPVTGGDADSLLVASGDLPVGDYDEIRFQMAAGQVHGAAAMMDHGEDDGHDGHGHGDHAGDDQADGASQMPFSSVAFEPDAFDMPLHVPFDLTEDDVTEIELALDVEASLSESTYTPTFDVTVVRGDETVASEDNLEADVEITEDGGAVDTQPPAARITVFSPDGDRVHEPAFDAQDGFFVNSVDSAFPLGEEIRFTATESEATEQGAAIDSETWTMGDGTTLNGTTVSHAYDEPGAYEVTLTVQDTLGATGTHTLRLVTVGNWTDTLVEEHFEDDAEGWNVATDGQTTLWALEGEGMDAGASWYASSHEEPLLAYEPLVTTTLYSPNVTVPEDWLQAGFSMHVQGGGGDTEGACIPASLTIEMNHADASEEIATFTDEPEWTEVRGEADLSEAIGHEANFTLTVSTSDLACLVTGDGWSMDAFTIGGIAPENFANHELLEDAPEGGHDHGDHAH